MTGFVRTMEKAQPPDGNYGVYALDCEMCYTTEGCDALRVTVVSSDGKIVYETLIKSINPVLDYNTRFSGITEEDLLNVKTTLKDVQSFLLDLLSSKTILIGHGLDADLRALRVIQLSANFYSCQFCFLSYYFKQNLDDPRQSNRYKYRFSTFARATL